MESAGRNYVTFHCDSKGNYEKFQCDVEKNICWCAEPLTGEVTAPFVPMVAMKKLSCCMFVLNIPSTNLNKLICRFRRHYWQSIFETV